MPFSRNRNTNRESDVGSSGGLPILETNQPIIMKTSEIRLTVTVDDKHIPEEINWEASESGMSGKRPCKATLLSIWDPGEQTTMRIDLWTKDMPVDDMKRFFFENFASMADTYLRATDDAEGANSIRRFSDEFARAAGLMGKK